MAESKMGKRAKKARDAMKKRRERRSAALGLLKDVVVAFVIVIIVMASLWAFSGGIWPPMVVVESESMMHDDDSMIGVIDTGDLTIVKKIHDRHDIVTYVEGNPDYTVIWDNDSGPQPPDKFSGKSAPHRTYSDYGDVIIYKKNGMEGTPVIHRAMVWIEANTTSECLSSLPMGYVAGGDFPDIKNSNHPKGLKCVSQLTLRNVGYKGDDIRIDVKVIMGNAATVSGGAPFSGFLTKGDHNRVSSGPSLTDQQTHSDSKGRGLAPIKVSWVVGKSVGELPWFGSLKLVMSKTRTADEIPPSSWRGLIITIVLILVIPFIIDMVTAYYSKKKRKRKKDDGVENEGDEEEKTKRGRQGRRGKGRGGRKHPETEDEEYEDIEEEESEEGLEEEEVFDDDLEEEFEDMAKSTEKKRRRR